MIPHWIAAGCLQNLPGLDTVRGVLLALRRPLSRGPFADPTAVVLLVFVGFAVSLWVLTGVCARCARLPAVTGLCAHRDFNARKPTVAEQLANLAEVRAKEAGCVGVLRDELYLNFSVSLYSAKLDPTVVSLAQGRV